LIENVGLIESGLLGLIENSLLGLIGNGLADEKASSGKPIVLDRYSDSQGLRAF
jgi:hypothetical protein